MTFDPVVSLRILNNERLRRATHWGEYLDLGGALALTSDAPIEDMNCIESFSTDMRHLEALLDIGFSLLRAYDRPPAVRLTPLDRPRVIEKALRTRRLVEYERTLAMVFRGDAAQIRTNPEVDVRVMTADDTLVLRDVCAPPSGPAWLRRMLRPAVLSSMSQPWHTFYIGSIDGQPAGAIHLLCEGGTAGIYGVSTLKAQRGRGVQSALLARAVGDALGAGCDVIGLRTAIVGDARRLFEHAGFVAAHEQALWTTPTLA